MVALCLKCFNIFNESTHSYDSDRTKSCPILKCGGDLIRVDENMIGIITTLNVMGYKTLYCCSGHIWSDEKTGTYISFSPHVKLPSLPEGFKLENHKISNDWIDSIIIRKKYSSKLSSVSKQLEIFNTLSSLLKWANDLPEHQK